MTATETSPADTGPDDGPGATPAVDRALLGLTVAAVLVGLVLRFMPRSGLWLDEALTANISELSLGDLRGALRRDGHPPLFYALLHVWGSIGGWSDWWLRALPGVFSTLTLPLAYLAGHRLGARGGAGGLGARRTGLLALAVMSLLPFGMRFAGEVRMYSLVILLVLAGYLVVDELLGGRRAATPRALAPWAVAAALVAGALLWTHYWSMWLLGATGLLALWRAWKDPVAERRAGARALVVGLVGGGVLFLPWVPDLLYQTQHTGTPWGELFGPASVVVITLVDFAGARFGIAQLLSYVLVVLVVLAAVAVFESARRVLVGRTVSTRVRTELVVLTLTMAIGWAASFSSGNTYSSRYAAVAYPLFVLAVAAGLATLRSRHTTALVLAAVLAASAWGSVSTVRFERSQTDVVVEAIGTDLAEHDVTEAVIVACPDQLGVATHRQVQRLLDDPIEVVPYPAMGDPRFVDWVDYGERNEASDPAAFVDAIRERLPEGATVYVVSAFTYRTFEDKCEQVLNGFASGHPTEALVQRDDDRHDEVANLWAVRPAS